MSQVTVGPTAVMALMAYEYVQKGGSGYAIVLSFLAGCVELIAGLLNLGRSIGYSMFHVDKVSVGFFRP